jgi:hypothetical protein
MPLCIKGWRKLRPYREAAPDAAEPQQKLKINVKGWSTKPG